MKTLTNALITHVMLMEHVPVPIALTAILVMMVTLETDSHVKTATIVTWVYVVTTLLVQISQVASHAPALMVSRVMRWTAVLIFANVVTLILTHVTLTMCIDFEGGYSCECLTGYSGDGVKCTDINECANLEMYQLTPL